jgi:hypothetical protein
MKRLLLLILCVVAFTAQAKHIVGGEIELLHISGDLYRINLIYYFDVKNNPNRDPEIEERFITVALFRKWDNVRLTSVRLNYLAPVERVEYSQVHCTTGDIITDRLVYTTTIRLPQKDYNHPQGYYISWQRCCRNYTITNIKSENPDDGGQYAGQTFYLEFPPVVKDGKPFINSSPHLFAPLSDYACPRKPYFVDFSGTDDDNDSLVYSLVNPLNTLTGDAVPNGGLPMSGPYPDIAWRAPFNQQNIMGGVPDLAIRTDGLLTVTPLFQGLFVFAVRCEEYRDGIKIGEVRRDFQMLVLDNCPRAQPPVVEAKPLNAPDNNYVRDNLNVSFSNATSDDQRCIEIRVTDEDSKSLDDNKQETVKIRAFAIGFKEDISDVLPEITTASLEDGSAATFTVCFPQCPYVNGPYEIGIITEDDACTQPYSDTIIVTVNVQPPPNTLPVFNEDLVEATVLEGAVPPVWNITGTDADLDSLVLMLDSTGTVNLADYGFTYTVHKNVDGLVQATLTWNTKCDEVDFSERTDFEFSFLLNDVDQCDLNPPDTMTFRLKMDLYDLHHPVIEYAPDPSLEEVTITKKIYELLTFTVNGSDEDNDNLILTGTGKGFALAEYGASFPGDEAIGHVTSPFQWNINCDKVDLDVKDAFEFWFIVIDSTNRCHYYLADTLDVTVQLEPPDNIPPILTIEGSEEDLNLAYTLGQTISLTALGTDADLSPQDLLTLELIDSTGTVTPTGFAFPVTQGRGSVSSVFTWKPDCSIFENAVYENNYTFTFRVTDGRCFSEAADTMKVDLTIKDVEKGEDEFLPPNFISPNGDGLNDFFAMVKLKDAQTGELVSILPKDNCTGYFVNIRIYNRWGNEVYESKNRDFSWYAETEATGVYFYQLKYSNKAYKGMVTVSSLESQRNR